MRLVLALLLLTGCASRDLKWEIAALNAQMAMMNQRLAALEANAGNAQEPANEVAAKALLRKGMRPLPQMILKRRRILRR